MSTETLSQAIGAGNTVQFGSGTQFLVQAASAPISIIAQTIGDSSKTRKFTNVPAGFKFTAANDSEGFDLLQVTSATAQTVTLAVGTDDITFSNQVTVAGNVTTQDLPASTMTNTAPMVTAAATAALVAANPARRRISISSDPGNVANTVVYIRAQGGNRIGFVVPGTSEEFVGTYALDYEAAAAGDSLYIAEES